MASNSDAAATEDLSWGRVIIAGAQDWVNVGKKDKSGRNIVDQDNFPDLYEPHMMRPLCNVPIASVHGAGCASHFVAIDAAGVAWMWGRNSSSQLGLDGEQWPAVPTGAPRPVLPATLGAPDGIKFVHAAIGRSHTLLVGSNGQVWAAGNNSHSQCGQPTSRTTEVKQFTLCDNLPEDDTDPIIQVSAGITFSMVLTSGGQVYAFGSAEHGQLGNGATGEEIGPQRKVMFDVICKPDDPVLGLEDKKIVQIASGNMHSLALDSEGFVYAWGDGGYCRTGFGHQREALAATPVKGYFMAEHGGTRAAQVFCGPSCSIVIDTQRTLSMAGKFKMSGDGGSGQPYTYFKQIEDLSPYKCETAASGGFTNFAVAPDADPVDPENVPKGTIMTVGWGQQCSNGELGMGNDAPLSSTRPSRIEPLTKVRVFQIAAGQHSTVFLARPGEAASSLPRHPHLLHPQECVECHEDRADDSPLECEKCEAPYHLGCLKPPLSQIPDDEWFCAHCAKEADFYKRKEAETEAAAAAAVNGPIAHAPVPIPAPGSPAGPPSVVAPVVTAPVENGSAENGSATNGENGTAKRKAEDEVEHAEAEAKKQRTE